MRGLAFALALGIASSALAQSEKSVQEYPLLAQAIRSMDRLRYTGARTVQFRKGPNAARHEEYIQRDGVSVRVEFADDSPFAGQVIVDDGKQRRHFLPLENEIRLLPPRRDEALLKVGRAISRGDFRIAESDGGLVAGRRTRLFSVRAASVKNMQQVYVDPDTAAVLKRALFDPVGTQIGYFEFTRIDFVRRLPKETFILERRGATLVTPDDELVRAVERGGFRMVRIPSGGGIRLEGVRISRVRGEAVLSQIYSTPLGKLSLFQVKALIPLDRVGRMRRGEVRVATWQSDGTTFTLIGPQTQNELDGLAKRLSTGFPKL